MKNLLRWTFWRARGRPSRTEDAATATGCRAHPARGGWRSRLSIGEHALLLTLALVVLCLLAAVWGLRGGKPEPRFVDDGEPLGLLPGEFEPQEGILLAWPRKTAGRSSPNAGDRFKNADWVYGDVVQAVWPSVDTIILVEDSPSKDRVTRLLSERKIPLHRVRFVEVPFESEWIRDYGPMCVRAGDGSYTWIDAEYVDGPVGVYPHEDRMPAALGALLETKTVRAPITIHHGNLLSNGQGLCLVTQKLLQKNAGRGYDEDDLRRILGKFYGAKEVVFLETLQGEPTGHIDMFATFTSPDTVVIGEYSSEYDPVNAAILDRNAKRLSLLASSGGPLKVARVPMPRRVPTPFDGDFWPTHTNVVYANGTLLVPVYPGWDPKSESRAFDAYRRLLPGWTIVGINAVPVLRLGGSVHCLVLNVAGFGKSPLAASGEVPQSGASTE